MYAQGIGVTTGTLAGDVRDDSGLPIANVLMTIIGREGGKTTTTDTRGKYIFPYVTPGKYDVRAEFQGYTTVEQFDVLIGLGRQVAISLHLKRSLQEIVTVTEFSLVEFHQGNCQSNGSKHPGLLCFWRSNLSSAIQSSGYGVFFFADLKRAQSEWHYGTNSQVLR